MGSGLSQNKEPPTTDIVNNIIANHCVVIFSKTSCIYCKLTKRLLTNMNVNYYAIELDKEPKGEEIQAVLFNMTGAKTVPRVFINKQCIGGNQETKALHEENRLQELIQECYSNPLS